MKNLIYLLLFFLIIFESSVTTLPLILLFLIIYTVFTRSESVFVLAFFSGLLIDVLTLRTFGLSSIFFLIILFLVLLYERKFEIGTLYFVSIATFFSSLAYLFIFPTDHIFSQAIICVTLSFTIFLMVKKIATPKVKAY